MSADALLPYAEALECVEALIQLGQRKKEAVLQRRHAELVAIVAAEGEIVARFRPRPAGKEGSNLPEAETTRLAAAVAELQRINATNAALLQEHLAAVVECLELLGRVARRPLLDVRA